MKTKTENRILHEIIIWLIFLSITLGTVLFGNLSVSYAQNELTLISPIPVPIIIVEEKEPALESEEVNDISNEEKDIDTIIDEVCSIYKNVDPAIVKALIYYESRYDPYAQNGEHVGLMQVSTYWHASRANRLGVSDFYDIRSNILIGVDFLSELYFKYGDTALVLMSYNMGESYAKQLYSEGTITDYASLIMQRADSLR